MNRQVLAILLSLFSVAAFSMRAEDAPKPAEPKAPDAKVEDKEKKKGNPARIYPRGPEIERLRTELGLSDEQLALAKDAVASVTKKNDELMANKDIAAAEEEVKKAKEALKVAEDKAKTAKDNFELNDEYKKAVLSAIPEDKKAKAGDILNYKLKIEKKVEKKVEKKDEPKAMPAVAPPAPPAEQK